MIQSKAILVSAVLAVGVALSPCVFAGELHEAVKAGDVTRVRTALANGEDVNALDMDWSALHFGSALGSAEIVQVLIDAGANLEAKSEPGGAHPLHLAAQSNQGEIAQLLIERGANASSRNAEDMTPLIVAIAHNSIDVGQILLKNGADPNEPYGAYKTTPLHYAAFAGKPEFAGLLIKHGGAVNAPSLRYSETPIFYAASHGHVEVLKLLVANGAETNVRNENGASPLNVALDSATREYLSSLGLKD